MKYKGLVFFVLLLCHSVFSQSKKDQIENLNLQKDSLGRIIQKERSLGDEKVKQLETKISNIKTNLDQIKKELTQSKKELVEKEEKILKLKLDFVLREDTIRSLRQELNQIKSFLTTGSIHFSIGNKVWMNKNLDVDKFRNGDPIPFARTVEEWDEFDNKGKPAWTYFENDPANGEKYGKLYNWYAVNDPRGLAPKGWHVASLKEWEDLIESQGGFTEETAKKFSSDKNWGIPDIQNVLDFNFNAKPGGGIRPFGSLGYLHFTENEHEKGAYWWTSTKSNEIPAGKIIYIIFNPDQGFSFDFNSNDGYYGSGLSVRCVKD